jgi:hypothetical protein
MKRQTRLTPAEGGKFHDPVGPSPELVAEIRAMTPERERWKVDKISGQSQKMGVLPDGAVLGLVHVYPGRQESPVHLGWCCSVNAVEPWTPRVGERVQSRDRNDVDQVGCIGEAVSVDEHLVIVRCDDGITWQTFPEYVEPAL